MFTLESLEPLCYVTWQEVIKVIERINLLNQMILKPGYYFGL